MYDSLIRRCYLLILSVAIFHVLESSSLLSVALHLPPRTTDQHHRVHGRNGMAIGNPQDGKSGLVRPPAVQDDVDHHNEDADADLIIRRSSSRSVTIDGSGGFESLGRRRGLLMFADAADVDHEIEQDDYPDPGANTNPRNGGFMPPASSTLSSSSPFPPPPFPLDD